MTFSAADIQNGALEAGNTVYNTRPPFPGEGGRNWGLVGNSTNRYSGTKFLVMPGIPDDVVIWVDKLAARLPHTRARAVEAFTEVTGNEPRSEIDWTVVNNAMLLLFTGLDRVKSYIEERHCSDRAYEKRLAEKLSSSERSSAKDFCRELLGRDLDPIESRVATASHYLRELLGVDAAREYVAYWCTVQGPLPPESPEAYEEALETLDTLSV